VGDTTAPETSGQPAASSPPPTRLAHFVIERPLGVGGMGMVLAARDVVLGREVALKIVRPGTGAKTNARLLREGQALARLSHPNVVTVYEVGQADGQLFIAMELVESAPGGTLREWARERHSWREVAARFADAGRGLAAMHEIGLVHRDFKPSNVLVDRRGAVKVADFGLVTEVGAEQSDRTDDSPSPRRPPGEESPSLTTPGTLVGTPAFMAPEQARGEPVDGRADQYSFCMSLRWALTGAYVADPARSSASRPSSRAWTRRPPADTSTAHASASPR
jgi:serine/threonine-protein kinase